LIETAAILVLATRIHAIPAGIDPAIAADCAWFLDMDLSILGADPATFAWYDAAIRVEYAAVPDAEWRARRPGVLATFLDRERLYLTDHFHARCDAQARINLRAAIDALA
jgi:predicted metal-dependent HD superfamily phosphohydrolase